jgi:hypothetical protein
VRLECREGADLLAGLRSRHESVETSSRFALHRLIYAAQQVPALPFSPDQTNAAQPSCPDQTSAPTKHRGQRAVGGQAAVSITNSRESLWVPARGYFSDSGTDFALEADKRLQQSIATRDGAVWLSTVKRKLCENRVKSAVLFVSVS